LRWPQARKGNQGSEASDPDRDHADGKAAYFVSEGTEPPAPGVVTPVRTAIDKASAAIDAGNYPTGFRDHALTFRGSKKLRSPAWPWSPMAASHNL
jgi:hypothetical protein